MENDSKAGSSCIDGSSSAATEDAEMLAHKIPQSQNSNPTASEFPPNSSTSDSGPLPNASSESEAKSGSSSAEPLTPAQLERIRTNRLEAMRRFWTRSSKGLLEGIDLEWFGLLEAAGEFKKPYFEKLFEMVESERSKYTIYPSAANVFSWTRMCPIDQIKVVIIGQDPYHGPNQAHGLCFSVLKPEPAPPSLQNMFKELQTDIEGFRNPGHGDLTGWATQGVLLLNSVLTVRAHAANSHRERGWEEFTDAAIETLLRRSRHPLVFLLWGSYAHKKGARIDKKRHCVLTAAHPSPLSASKGFFGCRHFSRANQFLVERHLTPIDWSRLP